jgi:hypothetical protein
MATRRLYVWAAGAPLLLVAAGEGAISAVPWWPGRCRSIAVGGSARRHHTGGNWLRKK